MVQSPVRSNSLPKSSIVSPSIPLAARRFICFQVSFRNSGVSKCASEVNLIVGFSLAFNAILDNIVDIPVCLCVHKMFLHLSPNFAPPLPPVHGFPMLRVLSVSPTSTAAFASLWLVLSVCILGLRQDHDGSPRFLNASFSIRAMLSDPAEVSSNHRHLSVAYYSLPSFRPCRPSVLSRGSIASLALRPECRSVYA